MRQESQYCVCEVMRTVSRPGLTLCAPTSEDFLLMCPSVWSLTAPKGTKAGLAEGKNRSLLDWPTVRWQQALPRHVETPCRSKATLPPAWCFSPRRVWFSTSKTLFLFLSVQLLRSKQLSVSVLCSGRHTHDMQQPSLRPLPAVCKRCRRPVGAGPVNSSEHLLSESIRSRGRTTKVYTKCMLKSKIKSWFFMCPYIFRF